MFEVDCCCTIPFHFEAFFFLHLALLSFFSIFLSYTYLIYFFSISFLLGFVQIHKSIWWVFNTGLCYHRHYTILYKCMRCFTATIATAAVYHFNVSALFFLLLLLHHLLSSHFSLCCCSFFSFFSFEPFYFYFFLRLFSLYSFHLQFSSFLFAHRFVCSQSLHLFTKCDLVMRIRKSHKK